MVAYSPDMSTEQRQELLETVDVIERLKLVSAFLARQVEILELKGKIQSEVKSEMDKTQREYILREQLKAIHRELGQEDDDLVELEAQVERKGLPEPVKARVLREIRKMRRMSPIAPASATAFLRKWLSTSIPPSTSCGSSPARVASYCTLLRSATRVSTSGTSFCSRRAISSSHFRPSCGLRNSSFGGAWSLIACESAARTLSASGS